ncbi:MAG: EscU/YscU/HrcU family type III secretion system export apparatus switch protein [Solirubrobacteraceae bacterium]|nr:EscU/YscU/HrcU family type III secretion system export apparatus switch protein [Solirubrobacteraceae bacterium]
MGEPARLDDEELGAAPATPKVKRAAALSYEGGVAPTVVAAGSGAVAERIEQTAREAGVPVQSDGPLAEALARLPVDSEIPPELYRAVAEVLIWARGLEMLARSEATQHGT